MIQFFVPGVPKAQPRPRKSRYARRSKSGKLFHPFYNPSSADDWKERIAWRAREARVPKLYGSIRLTLSFAMGGKGLVNGPPHNRKPDFDNLAKSCCDALTGIAWRDDAQIFDAHVIKRYGNPSGVLVTIEEVTA